jgi:hypothetical protein
MSPLCARRGQARLCSYRGEAGVAPLSASFPTPRGRCEPASTAVFQAAEAQNAVSLRDDLVTSSHISQRTALSSAGVVSASELANVPLFDSLDNEQLHEVANWFQVQNAGAEVRLVGEGAPGYTFFVVSDGAAIVTSENATVATLEAGDFFGEIAILGEGRRTATVTSTAPVRLLVMFGTEFRQLEASHPDIASRLREAMQARLAARASDSDQA